jgi:hypothetical protein
MQLSKSLTRSLAASVVAVVAASSLLLAQDKD